MGVLAAVVVLLICVVFIKRRRYLNKLGNKNTRLSNQSSSFHKDDNTSPGTISGAVSTQIHPVQPSISKMIWPIPISESETKARSYSYPGRRDAISGESKSSIKRKKIRKYRGSKSDSCYHVCQIQLTVFYNYYLSKLTVQIVCASKLPSTFGLNYGSYIEAELLPSSAKYTTNLQFQTNNPVFDESAEFPDIPSDELLNMTLKLRLYTVDRFSHGTLLGQVTVALAELDLNPEKPTTMWRPIVPNDQQVSIIYMYNLYV